MLDLAWRNLTFRKLRTFLTALAVAAPVALSIVFAGIDNFMVRDINEDLKRYEGQLVVRPALPGKISQYISKVASPVLSLSAAQSEEILQAAPAGYDPARTSPLVYIEVVPSEYPNGPAKVALWGIPPGREAAVLYGVPIAAGEGRLLEPGDAIIGPAVAEEYQVGVGDPLVVGGHTSRVRGLLKARGNTVGGMMVTVLAGAQAVGQRGDSVSAVLVGYADPSRVAAARAALTQAFPKLEVMTREDLRERGDKMLEGQRKFLGMASKNGLATAAVVIFLVMHMVVVVTHNPEVAARAGSIFRMKDGQLRRVHADALLADS